MSSPPRPTTTTAAQARVVDEVLGWGQPRPTVPEGLIAELQRRFDAALAELREARDTATAQRRSLPIRALVTPALTPAPGGASGALTHDRDTLRGVLLSRAFARDVELGQASEPASVVASVADEVAVERPADPGSASAWWNAAARSVRDQVVAEVVGVLTDLRTLWPRLPGEHLEVAVRRQLRAVVAGGVVALTGRPDVVIDSPRRDDRARALVVVTRSGMPRPTEDRALARGTALLHTLARARPPFRWTVLHLTDGRFETEDLEPELLLDTATDLGRRAAQLLTDDHHGGRRVDGAEPAGRSRARTSGGSG